MIKLQTSGSIFDAPVEALVNAVNIEGSMGGGLALAFKLRYPEMNEAYELACANGDVSMGSCHVYDLGENESPRWIINFPTMSLQDTPDVNRYDYIVMGMSDLTILVNQLGIKSIAIPALGCGIGGLDWSKVESIISCYAEFAMLEVECLLFTPQ